MNVSVPTSLASLNISSLNFSGHCENVALGYDVWHNDFLLQQPAEGSWTTTPNPSDDGPDSVAFWLNGTSPEFIQFWRAMLPPVQSIQNFSDAAIATWTNSTPFYDFFIDDLVNAWPSPDNLDQIANSLASSGGCRNNKSLDAGYIKQYSQFQQACIIKFCCSSDSDTEDSQKPYPYFSSNWTISSACAFDTCQHANKGNPDLGGIGIIVAYFIEASLLILSLIAFGIKLITDYIYDKPGRMTPRVLAQHDAAIVAGAGVFLDNAVFFSFSINFASIMFNYHAKPLLYEDKLGQTSSLLGIDAPVAIALMSYHVIDRKVLRSILVLAVTLMTFIIQFMFRKSRSFDPSTSLCLDWKEDIELAFVARFIAKAVWAGLVVTFFGATFFEWEWLPAHRKRSKPSKSRNSCWQRTKNSFSGRKASRFMANMRQKLPWRRLISYMLAMYGLFAIVIDIQFVLFLRDQESTIASVDNEDEWGYGQLLAIFVWIPVYVEYIYVFGFQRTFWGKSNRNAENIAAERRSYEMSEYASHRVPTQK